MNQNILVNIKREDFGFTVARMLAVVAWILGARYATGLIPRFLAASHFEGWLSTAAQSAPAIVYVAALGFVGYRLWVAAPRFAGPSGRATREDAMILASKSLLLSGLAMGVALYPIVTGASQLAASLIWMVQARAAQPFATRAPGTMFGAVFDVLLGAAVFGWAYSAAGKVKVPDLEYEEAETPGAI
ncbi:MAG: hypothetical protein ACYC96_04135 [Fimbriimonadaceae bacterium]